MDFRQQRGRHLAQAQAERIKPIEGALWYVPSEKVGGYLVNAETGDCTCPDQAKHKERCKHAWAVAYVRGQAEGGAELAKVTDKPAWPKGRKGDLTAQEQTNVRAALRFSKTRAGSYAALAKAIGIRAPTMESMVRRVPPSAGLAVRLARLAGVPVDDLLGGRYPPPGTCPHCGRGPGELSSNLPVATKS